MKDLLAPAVFLGILMLLASVQLAYCCKIGKTGAIVIVVFLLTVVLATFKLFGALTLSWLWVLYPLWLSVIGYAIWLLFYLWIWAKNYKGQ